MIINKTGLTIGIVIRRKMEPAINSEKEISALVEQLGDENGLVRQRARLNLAHIGKASVPALLKALESPNVHARREATKVVGELRAESAATSLANLLRDGNVDIRWAAMESLTRIGRASMRPLLEVFVKNFDSSLMREGVHHILHVLKDMYMLTEQETRLFEKLDKEAFYNFQLGWNSEGAWAAEKALEALDKFQSSEQDEHN
jgi:hypothetical protein